MPISSRSNLPKGDRALQSAIKRVRNWSAFDAAQAVAGLLTVPELGPVAFRLEMLSTLVLSNAVGRKRPTSGDIQHVFRLLHAAGAASMEDPAEDLFVSSVQYGGRNYRIFEGLWEANAFNLQLFCNILDNMPPEEPYNTLKAQVQSALLLSDTVASRRDLPRYCPGDEFPQDSLPRNILKRIKNLGEAVKFRDSDLEELNIDRSSIRPFLTNLSNCRNLSGDANVTASMKRPLISTMNGLIVVNPSSIPVAIREFVIQWASQAKSEMLAKAHKDAVVSMLRSMPHLGLKSSDQMVWTKIENVDILEHVVRVDLGRPVHILHVHSAFPPNHTQAPEAYTDTSPELISNINDRIQDAFSNLSQTTDFHEGYTLIVLSGWGNGLAIPCPEVDGKWPVHGLPLHDLVTLSWSKNFDPIDLFRIHEQVEKCSNLGIEIANPIRNVIDFIGWALGNSHSLIPPTSSQITPGPVSVVLPTNCMLRLRVDTALLNDVHARQDPLGKPCVLKRYSTNSFFTSDTSDPLYGVADTVGPLVPTSVIVKPQIEIWFRSGPLTPTSFNDGWLVFDGFTKWLPRLAEEICDELNCDQVPAIAWQLNYSPVESRESPEEPVLETVCSIRNAIQVTARNNPRVVSTRLSRDVMVAMAHRDNLAERAILWAFVDGLGDMLQIPLNGKEISERIVKTNRARQLHSWVAEDHADYVADQLSIYPVYLSQFDAICARVGLSEFCKNKPGDQIKGVSDCTRAINDTVDGVLQRLVSRIEMFNRAELIAELLTNALASRYEVKRWDASREAIRGIRYDDENASSESATQVFKHNLVSTTARVLIEMAICHAKESGGKRVGKKDLSQLMAYVEIMIQYGGVSDAISGGFVTAQLDVQLNGAFAWKENEFGNMYESYGLAIEDGRDLRQARFVGEDSSQSIKFDDDKLQKFSAAVMDEYGYSIDSLQTIVHDAETMAIEDRAIVSTSLKSELLLRWKDLVPDQEAESLFESITLRNRKSWENPPMGFEWRDIAPWRFRRRLSLIARPIVQVSTGSDPMFMWSAGILSECTTAFLSSIWQGDRDPNDFASSSLRSWVGAVRDERGRRFTEKCDELLKPNGWQTWRERGLNEIVGSPGLEAYGDIDILAFSPQRQICLLIECKRLHLAKTRTEMVRQMNDFLGKSNSNGKPDRLLRHLRRVDYLRDKAIELSKYCGANIKEVRGLVVFSQPVPMMFMPNWPNESMEFLIDDDLPSLIA